MNRAAVIEQLRQAQEMLANLLALLEAGEADKFAAHFYQARRQ
jgi:prephenate dehydrogenase